MLARRLRVVVPLAVVCAGGLLAVSSAQDRRRESAPPREQRASDQERAPDPQAPRDAVREVQSPRDVPRTRPEQKLTEHDKSEAFRPGAAAPLTEAFESQPQKGRITGFDFYRDPLNAPEPFTKFEEVMAKESAAKAKVMADQRKLLESRYDLTPRLDPEAKMSRGKPLPVGPTARLAEGLTWESLAEMSPEQIREKGVFPYPSLPHPLQVNGGQVFPKMQ
ncbi:MAG TPA: hypothetical protein VF170_01520, partial [Planctomycetaceae bacterium]